MSTLSTPKPEPCASSSVLVFLGHKNMLANLAAQGPENPKLERLEEILLNQFGASKNTRGIIFTRTRQSAYSLLLWLQQQPGLRTADIKPQMLVGAGNTSQSTHMTQVFGFGWRCSIGKKGEQGPQHRVIAGRLWGTSGLNLPRQEVAGRMSLYKATSQVW